MMIRVCVALILWAGVLARVTAGYGDKPDSLPTWAERGVLVMTNVCRMAPVAYRNEFIGADTTILNPLDYPAVDPVYMHPDLSRSAHAHAIDMAYDCGMQHNSCDGTSWDTRIKSYYTVSGWIAENIARGQSSPQAAVRTWVYDRGAADRSGGDGHRKNIMNAVYRDQGAGHAYSSSHYWCQDFGKGAATGFPPHTIPAACHLFLQSGSTAFLCNYFDDGGGAPQSVTLVLDGTAHAMSLDKGAAAGGTYEVSLPRGSACRRYYFEAVDSKGAAWRYPSSGTLITYGEGSCERDYEPPGAVGERRTMAPSHSDPIRARITDGVLRLGVASHVPGPYHIRVVHPNGRVLLTRRSATGAFTTVLPAGSGVYLIDSRTHSGRRMTVCVPYAGGD